MREAEEQPIDLKTVRRRLEGVVLSLETIQAVLVVTSEVLGHQAMDHDPEMALILMRCASDPLHDELKELRAIVTEIGGVIREPRSLETDEDGDDGHETNTN